MYATADDVRSVVARDPMQPFTAATLSNEAITADLVNAQGEVDGRLRERYTVPFGAGGVPSLVKAITIDIAAYLVWLRYYQNTEMPPSDAMMARYGRAMKLLCEIADGGIDLDAGGVVLPSTGGGLGAPINPYEGAMFGLPDFRLGYGRCDRRWV